MSRRESIITYSLLVFLCAGIILGTFLGDLGEIISTVITSITAVVGAIAVYIQMKKDKEINETQFLLEFSKFFYTFEGAQALEKKIDRAMEKGEIYEWTEDDYENLQDYMIWMVALGSMVLNKTLSLKLINNIFNYRFFTVVNNPSIQKNEINVYPTYYKSVFLLHKVWTQYRRDMGQPILFEEHDLSKLDIYDSMVKSKKLEPENQNKKVTNKKERTV